MSRTTGGSRRLHPYTAAVRGLSRAGSLGTLATVATVARDASLRQLQTNLGVILGVVVVALIYEFLYYQRFSYELTIDTFDIDSGVLSRREREIPVNRIQNIDISQSPVARLLGLAVLELETAGGGSTEARLRYVTPAEARRLQSELQAVKGEGDLASTPETTADRDPMYELDDRELWLLSLTSLDPGASVLVSFLGIGFQTLLPADPERWSALPIRPGSLQPVDVAGLLVALVVLAWVVSVGLVYSRYAGFRLYRVGDELRYERGLLGRYSGTIPLGKVQTASLAANPVKRRLGYVSLSLETAGYAPGSDGGRASETVLPLARRPVAADLVEDLEQFDAVETDLAAPPKRARQRYGFRYTITVALLLGAAYGLDRLIGLRYWYLGAALFVVVPAAAHLKWTNRGFGTTDGTFLARTGFWRRTTRVVPYHRLQTVVDTRSVFQRRRHLASVTADTASTASMLGGDATAFDIDADEATTLRADLAGRLQDSLAERRRERRRRRAGTPSWAGPAATDPTSDAGNPADAPEDGGGAAVGVRERSPMDDVNSEGAGRGTDDWDDAGRSTDDGDDAGSDWDEVDSTGDFEFPAAEDDADSDRD